MSAKQKSDVRLRVGVDTGGTFTDFVYFVEGDLYLFKLPSTPHDPSQAIRDGLRRIAGESGVTLSSIEVIHGTTVGTNALLERRGARIALITTAGFEDVIEIGRQARPELYNLAAEMPLPLVTSDLRFGVAERIASTGEILQPLDFHTLTGLVERLGRAQVEAVAVSLLFSFVDPRHELAIEEALSSLGLPLSISHRIHPEYREYERTSTVVINAYLQPLMGNYLGRLAKEAPSLRVMQSSGGSVSARLAAEEPVRTILSGPAGGVAGAIRAGARIKTDRIITFDMGGTSTDVALCEAGSVRMTNESNVSGLPVAVSMMDIHTVGAGGGSIARVDGAGSLRVGPESAGADPGPACYGRGILPTVTDANLVLRRFGGAGLLGGEFPLDEARAQQALGELAGQMSKAAGRRIGPREAALGVISVVNANMERALRAISVERGYDPRDFVLMPFGGAGGLHAVELARALRIPRVIAPGSAGAFSALGALESDVLRETVRTVMAEVSAKRSSELARIFREIEREALVGLRREGFQPSKQRHDRFLTVRYKGQSFELEIPWTGKDDITGNFHHEHERRYGYSQPHNPIEIVSARLRSRGLVDRIETARAKRVRAHQPQSDYYATVTFSEGDKKTAVYKRENLGAGAQLQSPCIITEYSSTTLVPPRANASVDAFGNILIDV
jgi:N-methylhydantoinase A